MRLILRNGLVVAGLVLVSLSAVQPVLGQASWNSHQVRATETQIPPLLDGFLQEGEWGRGGLIERLIQQEPNEGAPATERTEVFMLYDAETLYIGVRAWDSETGGVTATEMRRDSDRILDEDNFQIIFDTFKDSRSGYMFVTNPLGAKLDQQVFNEGEGATRGFGFATSNINRDWDGVWHVAAQSLEDGWVAEIAIPLVTLRFPEAQSQSWGMNLMRNIARKNEQAFWAPITKEFTIHRVSMAGSLEGLSNLDRGLDLRVTPFVTGGGESVLDESVEANDWDGNVGLDMKYGVTSGLNLDLTINTDFAQAEVDDEQVNLTRFPLFFPEKRDFFLENSGQFQVTTATAFNRYADLFFSRRVGLGYDGTNVPIMGGARMTGKIGQNDIAIMDVQTDQAFGSTAENFFVAKYSRKLWSRSRIGALVINKSSSNYFGDIEDAHYNRTYAVDALLTPHPNFTIQGFFSKTETPGITVPDDDPATPWQEDVGFGETGSYVNATWLDTAWRIYGEYADFDNDFNPEVGFLPRAGIRTTKLHLERNPRPNFWGIRVLSPMINYTYTSDQGGFRLADRWHYMLGARFGNGAFLNLSYNNHFDRVQKPFSLGGVFIPAGDYNFGEYKVTFDSNPARRIYYGGVFSPQQFYGGERWDAQAKLGARITDQLSTEASYTRNDVDLPTGDFEVDLASIRIDFAMSPTMSIRSVTQYNSQRDQFGTSARFRWTYRPGSDIYIVYDELQRDPAAPMNDPLADLYYRDRSLIIKATFLMTR